MFGLDQTIAHMSDGTTLVLVLAVAALLGLRHATDPDHVAAVSTLIAGGEERGARRARKLGLAWGLGHATTLFLFGLPVVLYERFLPEAVQQGAETAIGVLIVSLAVWLLIRWHRGAFHVHLHDHDDVKHVHVHGHAQAPAHAGPPAPEAALAVAGIRHRPAARRRGERRRRRAHHRGRSVEGARRRRAGHPGARYGRLDDARDHRLRGRARTGLPPAAPGTASRPRSGC